MSSQGKKMRVLGLLACVLMVVMAMVSPANAVRIKDVATVEGVRENSLIGYGLVVGLNGTGDKSQTTFTVQTLVNMLNKMGINLDPSTVKVKNVASVIVTAKLPPFMRPGSRIDVVVSSLGDATSLNGGTLLLTPLKGPDQQVYAVAQGPISVGGFVGGRGTDVIQKNHPTVGFVTGGAFVEKEVANSFVSQNQITLLLRQQDFTTATRVAQAINARLMEQTEAKTVDAGTVRFQVPEHYLGRLVDLIGMVEGLDVEVDLPAKVVVNERTGTIVMGSQVRISDVAISHGNLTIRVKTRLNVSQPLPFSEGETLLIPEEELSITEENDRLTVIREGATIGGVVRGLNDIGVTPRDLISILQAIKSAGALQAELEIL
jgi:flagellar P-ring protein precursor FlgI